MNTLKFRRGMSVSEHRRLPGYVSLASEKVIYDSTIKKRRCARRDATTDAWGSCASVRKYTSLSLFYSGLQFQIGIHLDSHNESPFCPIWGIPDESRSESDRKLGSHNYISAWVAQYNAEKTKNDLEWTIRTPKKKYLIDSMKWVN